MKIIFLPVFILSSVLMIAGIAVYQSDIMESNTLIFLSEVIHVGVIVTTIIVGIIIANKRRRSHEAGLVTDDVLSSRILCKTGLMAFYGSLFLWLILLYIQMNSQIFKGFAFSYGFIGMTLIFVITWIIYSMKGLKNE